MISLSKSIVGSREIDAVRSVLERGYLGMGREVQQFERDLESYIGGGRQVSCVNTGTAALHLALQALGVGSGDEVLIPTLTYVASFQAVSATGATPVACDVTETTGLLDVRDAEQRVTGRTRVVMPVHYASAAGNLSAVYDFAERFGLRVVEDAAHAFGCLYDGNQVGSVGDIVCFSFDGIKNITSGEGGAVVSADPEVNRRVRDARLLGVEDDTARRYAGQRSWDFDVTAQGWRYHMSDIMAAIGRTQLARFDTELKPRRVALAARYRDALSGVRGITLFDSDTESIVPHIFPVRVGHGRRDALRQALLDSGVQVGIHYRLNHLLTKFGGGGVRLPVAERIYKELLTLPLHPELSDMDVDRIVAILRSYLATRS